MGLIGTIEPKLAEELLDAPTEPSRPKEVVDEFVHVDTDSTVVQKQFDAIRNLTNEDKRTALKGNFSLARELSPELDEALKEEPPNQFKILQAKARLNYAIGYEGKPLGGENGARLIQDAFAPDEASHSIGVFKPAVKKTNLPLQRGVIKALKQYVLGQAKLVEGNKAEYEQQRELDAATLAQGLGFHVTAESIWASIGPQEGSLAKFLGGYQTADKFDLKTSIGQKLAGAPISDRELTKLQTAFVFDYLTGDLDGKSDNWMIKGDERGQVADVRFIDFGNAFPYKHRWHPGQTRNQFKWGELGVSQKAFTDETKAFVRLINPQNLEATLSRIPSDRLSEAAREQIRQRLKILQTHVGGKLDSPAKLSQVQSEDSIYERWLSPSNDAKSAER